MGCVSNGRAAGNAGRGISLQWLVALAIVLGMLLLGAALAWQGYHGIRQTLVAAAGDSAQQIGKTIDERARRLIDPVHSSIRLLAHNPAAQTPAQRLERLPQLVETLDANRMLSAAYMGYPSGEFLLVRRLREPQLLQRFAAPPGWAQRSSSIAIAWRPISSTGCSITVMPPPTISVQGSLSKPARSISCGIRRPARRIARATSSSIRPLLAMTASGRSCVASMRPIACSATPAP